MSKFVLVAEDDNDISGLVVLILEEAGFRVASTMGANTLGEVRKHNPDVVLLDYQMPGMDGVRIAQELRSHPETKDIPIIAMTAAGRIDQVCYLMDADGCLGKPFDIDNLVSVVRETAHTAH